jgi:hypothetical protein
MYICIHCYEVGKKLISYILRVIYSYHHVTFYRFRFSHTFHKHFEFNSNEHNCYSEGQKYKEYSINTKLVHKSIWV